MICGMISGKTNGGQRVYAPNGRSHWRHYKETGMAALQERTVSVWENKIKPKIQVAGSGPPVVFLHGAYGLTWDPFLDELAKSFTVYAPEHPGTTWGDPDGIKPL